MQSWVYVIKSQEDCFYVGSTRNLRARLATHRYLSQNSSRPLYACIRGLGGWEAVEFRVLEMNADLSQRELRMREQHEIERLRPIFNRNRAYSSLSGTPYHREYRAARGLDHFRAYNQAYFQRNRGRINEQRRRARQVQRDAVNAEEIREAALVLETMRGSP